MYNVFTYLVPDQQTDIITQYMNTVQHVSREVISYGPWPKPIQKKEKKTLKNEHAWLMNIYKISLEL